MTGDGLDVSVWMLLRASVMLAVAGICVGLLNWWRPLNSVRWHRIAWCVVLIQGLILFPLTLQLEVPQQLSNALSRFDRHGADSVSDTRDAGLPDPQSSFEGTRERKAEVEGWQDMKPLWDQGLLGRSASSAAEEREGRLISSGATRSSGQFLPALSKSTVESIDGVRGSAGDEHSLGSQSAGSGSETASGLWNFSTLRIVGALWLVGVAVVLGILLTNFLRLQRSLRLCHPARPRWAAEFQRLCLELGIGQQIRLEVHPQLGPFLCWTPRGHRVVVPVRLWNRLSEAERLSVLHHELCHLRRGDLWKACAARFVVALHWFNPLAWYSARRFDESAEWACDARMAQESPVRVASLANALLTASQGEAAIPYLALSVTGGPLFQRVRRLVTGQPTGDSVMHKLMWISFLALVAVAGGIRLTWYLPSASAQEQTASDNEDRDTEDESDSGSEEADRDESDRDESGRDESDDEQRGEGDAEGTQEPAEVRDEESLPEAEIDKARLSEFAERIVTGDSESLRKFKALMSSPHGQIVMADRAAVTAQEASQVDMATAWQQFVARYFERSQDGNGAGQWKVKDEQADTLLQFDQEVTLGNEEIEEIRGAFQDVSVNLVDKEEISKILQRFLQHEGAPAFVYHTELRARLHPGMDQLEERFQDHLVRTSENRYAIRAARGKQVQSRLEFAGRLQAPINRLQKELAAWADDLVKEDETHQKFAETLRSADFACFLALSHVSEESRHIDEDLDGVFGILEEATSDTASGLKLNTESDQYREIHEQMDRFHTIWAHRDALQAPLHKMAEGIDAKDELHERLREFLKTDMALIAAVREMDYLPVSAGDAAREWLSQIVTQNDAGKYEITLESPEDLNYRVEDFFRQFRDLRRRGRIVDEFAAELQDPALKKAMQTYFGKLNLGRLVEASVETPEVDGLAIWFSNHFEETPDGLVLHDWALEAIDSVVNEAAEIENQMKRVDF